MSNFFGLGDECFQKGARQIALAALLVIGGNALAIADPVLPADGEDTTLIDAIKNGLKDTTCIADRDAKLAAYQKKAAEVANMATAKPAPTAKQINTAENELAQVKVDYLAKVELCGPCRTNTLKDWAKASGGHWYVTDGSCWIEDQDAKVLKDSYVKMTDSLRKPSDYAKFPGIVKVAIANAKGDGLDTSDTTLPDKYNAFLAIGTPVELAGRLVAFYYYIQNSIVTASDASNNKTFSLSFKTAPSTKALNAAFTKDPIKLKSPGGRSLVAQLQELKSVEGKWFISETGSMRYATFGDFKFKNNMIGDHARQVLLEALLEMHRRATAAGGQP